MRRVPAILLLLLAGCATTGETELQRQRARTQPVTMAVARFQAVVVAGDASINAFDNAADRLSKDLSTRTNAVTTRFSARPGSLRPPGIGFATVGNVLDGIARLRPAAGEGCLVFATAHGVPRQGLYLPADANDTQLDPNRLDRALVQGCGAAPTVLVLSGCFSGGYLREPLIRDNRIIITAARADRPSFGCGAGDVYTEFDDCLLTALEAGQGGWRDTFSAARACVGTRERAQHMTPSEPQAWFGANVAGLALPWQSR